MQRRIIFVQLSLCVFVCGMAHADWLRAFPLPFSDGRYVDMDGEGRVLFIDYVAREGVVLAQLDPQDVPMIIGGFVLPEQRQAYLLYSDKNAEEQINTNTCRLKVGMMRKGVWEVMPLDVSFRVDGDWHLVACPGKAFLQYNVPLPFETFRFVLDPKRAEVIGDFEFNLSIHAYPATTCSNESLFFAPRLGSDSLLEVPILNPDDYKEHRVNDLFPENQESSEGYVVSLNYPHALIGRRSSPDKGVREYALLSLNSMQVIVLWNEASHPFAVRKMCLSCNSDTPVWAVELDDSGFQTGRYVSYSRKGESLKIDEAVDYNPEKQILLFSDEGELKPYPRYRFDYTPSEAISVDTVTVLTSSFRDDLMESQARLRYPVRELTIDSNAVRESIDTLILLGEYGLIERYDSSFTSRAQGKIPGAGERMGVSTANLSWNNEALLIAVGPEGGIVECRLEDMQMKRGAVPQLPEGLAFRDGLHVLVAILPLAHRQIYVRDDGYVPLPELGKYRPTTHIDLPSGEARVLNTFAIGGLSDIRVAPAGDRFVLLGIGKAVMVDAMTGHILREVAHLAEYRRSLYQEPEAGKVYLLGYEVDWEQEALDCWWISMAPENAGEVEHVLVSMKTGERLKQTSMSPWPELPDFDRFEFPKTFLESVLYHKKLLSGMRERAGSSRPLLRLVEAHTLARLSARPALLENLPSEKLVTISISPQGRFLLGEYFTTAEDRTWEDPPEHSRRIVILDTETGAIEADFVFKNPVAGVFFPGTHEN